MEESLYLDRLKGPLLSVPVRGTEKAEKIWEPHLQPTFSPVWPWACATLSIPTHLGMTSHVWNESSKEGFFINCDCFYFHMKISKENIIFPPWIFFFHMVTQDFHKDVFYFKPARRARSGLTVNTLLEWGRWTSKVPDYKELSYGAYYY